MKLIVGLGNPGRQYEKTRHNVGFMVLDMLHDVLRSHDISPWELSKKFNADIAEYTTGDTKIMLCKPMTFMNASGQSVQLISAYYKLSSDDIIVVHDDKDIVLGDIKVQHDRSAAGHNGIKSIIEHLGTQAFTRIRIGIKRTDEKKMVDTSSFVLGKFSLFEKMKLHDTMKKSVETILSLL